MKVSVPFLAAVKYKNKLYFSALKANGLFRFDMQTGETKFICFFYEEKMYDFLHVRAFLHNKDMWLVPAEADHVACVNLETYQIRYFDIPGRKEKSGLGIYAYYDGIVEDGKYLYLIPQYLNDVIKINMEKYQIECSWTINKDMLLWSKGCFIYNDTLNLVTSDGNVGIKISVNTDKVEVCRNDVTKPADYLYAFQSGSEVWIIPCYSSEILVLNVIDNKLESIPLPECNKIFYRGMDCGKSVLLFPGEFSRVFAVVNKFTRDISLIDIPINNIDFTRIWPHRLWIEFSVIDTDDDEKIITSNSGHLFRINDEGCIVDEFTVSIDDEVMLVLIDNESILNKKLNEMYSMRAIQESEPFFGLREFLCHLEKNRG